nr:putative nuclease HARBI1 [Dermacentor andersoni]
MPAQLRSHSSALGRLLRDAAGLRLQQMPIGSEETIGVTQPAVSKCVRRVAEAIVHAGARNKWVRFPRTSEEKAAVKEGFLRRGSIPGVIECVDGNLIAIIAPKGEQKAAFMCRKGYYALNTMFICDAGMRILAVDALRPGSDHDAHVWRTTWLRRRLLEGRIANAGEHLLSDSGYPLEPWLLTPVTGHPPIHTAEGRYNTAHAAMRSVVERCIGLLKSRFRCLQRYRALHYEPDRAANILAACAVLHNLCLDEGGVSDDVSDDCSSSSSSDDESGNPYPQRVPRNVVAASLGSLGLPNDLLLLLLLLSSPTLSPPSALRMGGYWSSSPRCLFGLLPSTTLLAPPCVLFSRNL